MRRQNVAQWVNLQLSSSPVSPCPNFCLHAQIHNYFRTRRPGSLLMLSPRRGIVSLTPRVLCLHHLGQHAPPSAPPVGFSITSHVRDTLRPVPPWRLQQELLRRRLSSLPTRVFEVLFLHRSVRALNQHVPLRLFGETKICAWVLSTQARPRVTPYLRYILATYSPRQQRLP